MRQSRQGETTPSESSRFVGQNTAAFRFLKECERGIPKVMIDPSTGRTGERRRKTRAKRGNIQSILKDAVDLRQGYGCSTQPISHLVVNRHILALECLHPIPNSFNGSLQSGKLRPDEDQRSVNPSSLILRGFFRVHSDSTFIVCERSFWLPRNARFLLICHLGGK